MKRYKVGIVGCGRQFLHHIQALERIDHVDIVALCDHNPKRLLRAQTLYGGKTYTNYQAMIAKQRIDCIHLCVPEQEQFVMIEYFSSFGIHIVIEAPTYNQSYLYEEALKLSQKYNNPIAFVNPDFYRNTYQKMHQLVCEKTLGSVKHIRVVVGSETTEQLYREGSQVLDLLLSLVEDEITKYDGTFKQRLASEVDMVECWFEYKNRIQISMYGSVYCYRQMPIEIWIEFDLGTVNIMGSEFEIKRHDNMIFRQNFAKSMLLESIDIDPKQGAYQNMMDALYTGTYDIKNQNIQRIKTQSILKQIFKEEPL